MKHSPKSNPHAHDTRYRVWMATCQGKEKFESRAIAEKVARKRGNSAYKCRGCGKWHTGRC